MKLTKDRNRPKMYVFATLYTFAVAIGFGAWQDHKMRLGISVAAADTFPGTNDSSGADGTYVTQCWDDSGSAPSELTAHLSYVESTWTNLTIPSMESCNPTTDMRFDDTLTTSGLLGLRTCNLAGGDFALTTSTSDIECDSNQVQINLNETADCSGMDTSDVRRANWCHESGHALGLGHENNCMQTGCFTANTYSSHHISHVSTY